MAGKLSMDVPLQSLVLDFNAIGDLGVQVNYTTFCTREFYICTEEFSRCTVIQWSSSEFERGAGLLADKLSKDFSI